MDSVSEIVRRLAAACGWQIKEDRETSPRGANSPRIVVDVPTGGTRRQVVAITRDVDIADQEIVRYWSVIGPAERVDLEKCLMENSRLCHGAFAIRDKKLVLVDTQLAAHANPQQIAAAIGNVAAYADRFERELFGADVY